MPRPIKRKASKKEIGSEVEIQGVLTDLRDTLKKKQYSACLQVISEISWAALLQ